jgi:hypothetical protein
MSRLFGLPVVYDTCSLLMIKGERSGAQCGNRAASFYNRVGTIAHVYCSRHAHLYAEFEARFLPRLPDDPATLQTDPRLQDYELPTTVINLFSFIINKRADLRRQQQEWNTAVMAWIQNITEPTNEVIMNATSMDYSSFPSDPKPTEECCVCYNTEKLLITGCRHVICFECLQKVSKTCPMCRVSINLNIVKRFNEI